MSHRNNDNVPWNNRNPRNNNDGGGGGGGGNYKAGNWGGNTRYGGPDNRYNNNNKDRRNYRGGYGGGGGGGRRSYEDRRPYRNNSWNNNNGGPDGGYPRYQNSWHQKNGAGTKYNMGSQLPQESEVMQQQIPPLMIDFDDSAPQGQQNQEKGAQLEANDSVNGNEIRPEGNITESNTYKSWGQEGFASPVDGFQGFTDDDFIKASNGGLDSRAPSAKQDKGDMSLQENELRTLIVDEAMKIISDAEQPSCSIAASQSSTPTTSTAATVSTASTSNQSNPERRASIERSAEQVTRKLINQLTSMNKHSLKQVINNPDSKYETALKTHARQKLRAEVRRQLRNFNLNDNTAQTKTSCGMLEPDECVDSDKIPEALLEQIGKVLDLNLLDLNVTEEPEPTTAGGDEDDCVMHTGDVDYSATEVLDKNLRLTDEDDQFDTVDLFARAELLLMKGSESVRQGNSSCPSSPTDEMFPNEQIDSIVSEDNNADANDAEPDTDLDADPDQEQIEKMLDERLAPNFPCFLRVSTVEELNKKVDDLPVPMEEPETPVADHSTSNELSKEQLNEPTSSNTPSDVAVSPTTVAPDQPETQISTDEIAPVTADDQSNLIESILLPVKEDVEEPATVDETTVVSIEVAPKQELSTELVTISEEDKPVEEAPKRDSDPSAPSPEKAITPEQPPAATIRAPTHPELAARKPKGSKTYKPNLVQHEHSKRDGGKSTESPSRSSTASNNATSSKAITKTSSSSNLNSSKQNKHQNNSNNNTNSTDKNNSSSSSRGRSRGRRETATSQATKDNSVGSSDTAAAKKDTDECPPSATPSTASMHSAASSPAQQSATEQPPPQRSARAKTPGPSLAGGPMDHSSPLGVKKKKKKRNKRKDRSPPPDMGMVLECDLRISRPAVTPTPPPVQSREPSSSKKSVDPERSGSSSSNKPSRETRAKSADPKFYNDSRKERQKERDKDKQRSREDDNKKGRNKEDKKDHDKDKDKNKQEKMAEIVTDNGTTAIETGKTDRNVRKKSPLSKSAGKSSIDAAKNSAKDDVKEDPKEEVAVQKEKELPKDPAKDEQDLKVEEFACEKDSILKDKGLDVPDGNETSRPVEIQENHGAPEIPAEQDKPVKPEKKKKKKSLLKGPNLIKGRREVLVEPETQETQEQQKQSDDVIMVIESTPSPSRQSEPDEPPQTRAKQKDTKQSHPAAAIPQVEHPMPVVTSTSSLVQRTASPRPWKSPGEKKLIPPAITNLITQHPMSPPPSERARKTPTPTPPSPVMSPEPPIHLQRAHLSASPVISVAQSDVISRMPLQSSLAPLVATTVTPPMGTFAPVMTLLNQMQEIDNKMSEFQRRKMQIDSDMMRLNSEKFQIDQNSMQLQNERFMLLNTLRAALVECELTTIASMQSVTHMSVAATSPTLGNRRRNPEPEPELAPRTKRRKENHHEAASSTPQSYRQASVTASSSVTDLSETEEPPTPTSAAAGGERTIRRITKISGNTEILKLFQRRRLISDRSAEESQPEDNGAPCITTDTVLEVAVEKPVPAKRRRTRTYGGGQTEVLSTVTRLRSDSTRSIESGKSIEIIDQPPPATSATKRLKRDEEIPLAVHRNILPREVKVVVNKLNVAGRRGPSESI